MSVLHDSVDGDYEVSESSGCLIHVGMLKA
jgi:hypothetical protein